MYWKKLSHIAINERINSALAKNKGYRTGPILGVPGTYLDSNCFYNDAPFLEDAPFLRTLIENPNHIGCHTLTKSEGEPFFQGTQEIEIELIKLCAEEILGGETDMQDGYVAPGGTEANIEAAWVYRNYFINEHNAKQEEIAIVYSEDAHYSMPKAANLLNINSIVLDVDNVTRKICPKDLEGKIKTAQKKGTKYFIVIQNMATTMFGSIDDIDATTTFFTENNITFKLHIDGAFGGFIYPFTNPENSLTFKNPHVSSITIDAHKMLQAPYGTGVFLIRKGLIHHVESTSAKYVHGKDFTICGSRSGAISVSIWMILMSNGSAGLTVNMEKLIDQTDWACMKLDKLKIKYFREEYMNIITIDSNYISSALAKKYFLVADNAKGKTSWWKIVIMPHVKQGYIDAFLSELAAEQKTINC